MALLFGLWPNRAESPEAVAVHLSIYRQTCGELSDEAWLAACTVAVRTCEFFPMPVKVLAFAEAFAEATVTQRIDHAETQRIAAGQEQARHMLTAGVVSEEDAAARREQIQRRVADTAKLLREINANQPKRQGSWRHTDRAIGHQRIADGHWDTPSATTDD
jgi:hypothetical protein